MSFATSAATFSEELYGLSFGRGELERRVIDTLRLWIIPYIADYERLNAIPPRTLPVPPTPESIHGGIDFTTFSAELFPELIVVVQPTGSVERRDPGMYGQWFSVEVSAIVMVEGDQDQTRTLADAYGTALQKLLPQQGAFGLLADGVTTYATRTRLYNAYGLIFPDASVRDIMRANVMVRSFLENLVDDFAGPRTPPQDPYAVPGPPIEATKVEVDLIRGDPTTEGFVDADGVVLDGTVYPPVIRSTEHQVDEPGPDE